MKDFINKSKVSDSFAKHFASYFTAGVKITVGNIRPLVKTEILWQGNIISCMKTFGKLECCLCMQERLEIYKAM